MTWAEIGRTTLPQARLLLEQTPHVDGHAHTAHAVCDTFLAIAEAAGLIKRSESTRGPARSGPSGPAAPGLAPTDVLIPELDAIIEARVAARLAATATQGTVPSDGTVP